MTLRLAAQALILERQGHVADAVSLMERVLAGTADACGALADPRRRFVALGGMVDKAKADIKQTKAAKS